MAQTLLLGLGGTGSRIVNNVANDLKKKKIRVNDGNICCTVLDTNENDQNKIKGSGVGIPVVATSKDRKVEDYLKMYAHKGVRDWMPESPSLLKESMKDGASQMRPKSRLAFMDIIEDRTIHELEAFINKLFDKRDDAKIRVMIVSSLAGGTGSGMFIQAALWVRNYFAKRKCSITIRGIFVLPDVFVNTVKDIREDDTERASLYANAYGAIRELNAITKIKTKANASSLLPVRIDTLFDSEKNQPDGTPVFDYAFFIDDISEGGSVLQEIEQYEQVVARLVYMQMYAPMHDDLYSEEDNLFKRFQKSTEPVFGSCGTAKAIYPTEDIVRYCALRASQDAISTGWRRIDDEIAQKQQKEEEKEASGAVINKKLNPVTEYIRMFETLSAKSGEKAGRDRLFLNIANDVKNEELMESEDGNIVNYTDKIEDFMENIDELIATTIDTEDPGSLSKLRLKKDWVDATGETVETLKTTVTNTEKKVKRFIDEMEEGVDGIVDTLMDQIFSTSMGDVNMADKSSIYGLLSKKDSNNQDYFVHPIAVRYLLYKLRIRLDEIKADIVVSAHRSRAEKGYKDGDAKIEFDNAKTRAAEDSPVEYLESMKRGQQKDKGFKEFKSLYVQHNANQAELCRTYAINIVKHNLAIKMQERLAKLVEQIEQFFKDLVKVSNTLKDSVAENVRKNEETVQKVMYICASGEEKEALYKSINFNTGNSDHSINGIIVDALYGKFCALESPASPANANYADRSVVVTFFTEVVKAYQELIVKKNKDDIDLDIYSAVCKSADIAAEKEAAKIAENEQEANTLNIDLSTGEVVEDDSKHQRHISAMQSLVDDLMRMGAPFLISDDEQPEDNHEYDGSESDYGEYETAAFMPIKKRKTFWGFNPIVSEKCSELGAILGINVSSQENIAYAKNELDCYRAVYGIQAGYIPKFNELNGGDYYTCYRDAVDQMVLEAGKGNEAELIHTPHLDKTWHLFLPYITPEKQRAEDEKFYRLFWLALAYGMISLNKSGKYQVARTRKTVTGEYIENEVITFKGKEVGKVDVDQLVAALKLDGSFMLMASRLAKKFEKECEEIVSYESTELLRGKTVADGKGGKNVEGGLASEQDNNAVTVIVRYHKCPRHDTDVTAMLIQSLEKLLQKLIENKYERGEEEKVKQKAFELCQRIYNASAMKDKDIDLIRHWKEAWSN